MFDPTKGVGILNRSEGCLFPHTDPLVLSQIRQVQLWEQSFLVCLPPIWFSPITLHLHQGGEGSGDQYKMRTKMHFYLDDWLLQRAHSHGLCPNNCSWLHSQPYSAPGRTDTPDRPFKKGKSLSVL